MPLKVAYFIASLINRNLTNLASSYIPFLDENFFKKIIVCGERTTLRNTVAVLVKFYFGPIEYFIWTITTIEVELQKIF